MAKDMRIIPADMPAQGGAVQEQTSPVAMRVPSGNVVTHDGPQKGSNDEFLPASYEQTHQTEARDGTVILHKLIRHDR